MARVLGPQALAIRKILKKHLRAQKVTGVGRVYTFSEIQTDVRSFAVTEGDVRDAVDDRRLKRDYWFDIQPEFAGERGKVLLIIPKAQLFSKLSEFQIPDVCYSVRDRLVGSMYKIQGMPLIFTNGWYASGYISSTRHDGVVKEISWEEITGQFDRIVLDYVDSEHELPIFDVTAFMIEYYMHALQE